ncbi:MAG TPA: hypothetical protein VNG51_09130 [Ktedonobacteraceae bacterium]|nr:hypothetical protein [Ktedonobacteraceae bacterium]
MKKGHINFAQLHLPQKIYPLRERVSLSIVYGLMCLPLALIAIGCVWWAITGGPMWILILPLLYSLFFVWIFRTTWSRRLEFSADGVTLYHYFYQIYAPWTNIIGYDKHTRRPHIPRRTPPFYGGFVYKEPALLYTSIRRGKEKQRTVVQIPRLRAQTNPELVAYLSHYFPIFPGMFPEKDLPLLLSEESVDKRGISEN